MLCKQKLSTSAPADLAPAATWSAKRLLLPFSLGLPFKIRTYLPLIVFSSDVEVDLL
jgi:hypothetical protein